MQNVSRPWEFTRLKWRSVLVLLQIVVVFLLVVAVIIATHSPQLAIVSPFDGTQPWGDQNQAVNTLIQFTF